MATEFIKACNLRGGFKTIRECPGWYRWWFPEHLADDILSLLNEQCSAEILTLRTQTIGDDKYVCLYVGISKNLHDRVRIHIEGPFGSSTFRRTLRAILVPNSPEHQANVYINKIIDSCYWEWEYTDTKEQAENIECEELSQLQFDYPLNIKDNETISSNWIRGLKKIRNKSVK